MISTSTPRHRRARLHARRVHPPHAGAHAQDRPGEKGAVSAQKLGQFQPLMAVVLQECMGQLGVFLLELGAGAGRGARVELALDPAQLRQLHRLDQRRHQEGDQADGEAWAWAFKSF